MSADAKGAGAGVGERKGALYVPPPVFTSAAPGLPTVQEVHDYNVRYQAWLRQIREMRQEALQRTAATLVALTRAAIFTARSNLDPSLVIKMDPLPLSERYGGSERTIRELLTPSVAARRDGVPSLSEVLQSAIRDSGHSVVLAWGRGSEMPDHLVIEVTLREYAG